MAENPASAIAIGLIAGSICSFAIALKFRFGFDDSLDVVGVHLVGGLVGSVLIGFFAHDALNGGEGGLFFGGGIDLLVEQIFANGVTLVFSFVVSFAILKALDLTMGIRVEEDSEAQGLDITEHAETAYNHVERAMGRI